ncbi:AAA family ATPase [bacterium]|nr:AAA family ATPase [bacterium]
MSINQTGKVPVNKLRWQCDPKSLDFETTDEVECCNEIIGQQRALRAIKMGLEIKSPGYNIFVAGLTGTGKTTTIKKLLEQIDKKGGIPDDICYVYNFSHPDKPSVLRLPAGKGKAFANDMDELIGALNSNIPKILDSDEYKKRSKEVLARFEEGSKELLKDIERKVKDQGFAIVQIQTGTYSRPDIFPVVDEEVVPWDKMLEKVDKGELKEEDFEQLKEKRDELAEDLENLFRQNRDTQKQMKEAIQELKNEFCSHLVKALMDYLTKIYTVEEVQTYLKEVEENILQNLDRFAEKEEKQANALVPPLALQMPDEFQEFKVNVVVDNSELDRVPIINETAPSYRNLFGTIERAQDRSGVWHTDFTKIRAGSILQANGGYLVIDLLDAVVEPGVWPALKRTLKNRKLDIQTFDPFYLFSTSGMKPEAVDIDVKVVIVGDAYYYQVLYANDEGFKKIFKVRADFDTVIQKDDKAVHNYTRFIKKICDEERLKPFRNSGVAEIIEYGVRLAGRQNKISTRFSDVADLVREAHYWAVEAGSDVVSSEHVNKAIDEKVYRSRMMEDKIQEMIEEDVLMIEIDGKKVGQVNGLSVYMLGDYSFGRPSKITAEVSMGRAGIINIEREADLSGKTHNKGVLIIGGYFRGKYAQNRPLTMSASLAFEQSYSGVDGDSASSTEIYAILSELSGLPLRQDIAVTGSVNQKGEIQPIGGVNQKVEGFFDVCKAKGLTGQQGVMIPSRNVDDLMLRQEIVEAVKDQKFHLYSIRTIDEGIEILTGVAAGKKGKACAYPKDTVHFLVDRRLGELASGMREFMANGHSDQDS